MKKVSRYSKPCAPVLAALALFAANATQAANIFWSGTTASYTNAASWGGTVPGTADAAINDNGTNNRVQVNIGDPDWTIIDLQAGSAASTTGAYELNGQTVNVTGWARFGLAANSTGWFILNGGTLNVLGGRIMSGEAEGSSASFTFNSGVINKTGDFFIFGDAGFNGQHNTTVSVTQNGGTINSSSEIWVGQMTGATTTYDMHGGTINSTNWFVIGRGGSHGTFTMDGGTISHYSGGTPAFIVGDAAGGASIGTLNHSAGTINCVGAEFWIGNGGGSFGTNNMSGTAVLNGGNWIAVGRGGNGYLNLSGGVINKTGGGNIVIGAFGGTIGVIDQTGGVITNTTSQTWVGENGNGTWNMNGGSAVLGMVHIAETATSVGVVNLNGGVMTASEITMGNTGGFGVLNLNGGTIRASGDNNAFLHDISIANVDAGGVTLDSQGFNIVIPQTFNNTGGGSVTKTGSGTVTLNGLNSYTGPTVVSAGRLNTTTDSTGGGAVTVADGARFGLKVQNANAQLNTANLTLANSTAATLDFDLGPFGNPSSAPVTTPGTLAVNGAITVNIADTNPQIGQFPLIQYATRTGNGSFVVGSLPVNVVATIVTNTSSIDLKITAVNLPRWDGQAGGTWDIGATANWVNIGNGLPTVYAEGNVVQFDDNALGTTSVNLGVTVNPGNIIALNSTLPYTLYGTGKISGPTKFTKNGTGTFTVANTGGNNYTGATTVGGGTLAVTNLANGGVASAIGASSANPTNLVLQNGALSYAGPAVTINRGYSLQGTNGIIDVQTGLSLNGSVATLNGAGFSKSGPGQLTHSMVGSNALTGANSSGYFVQNGTVLFDGTSGNQTNTIQGSFRVGDVNVGANVAVTLTNAGLNVTGTMELGNTNGATATLTISSNSTITVRGNPFVVGRGVLTGTTGIVNQIGGTVDSRNELWIGQGANGFGGYTMTNGNLMISNWFALGRQNGNGVMNVTGGTITKASGGNFIIGTGAGNNSVGGNGLFNFSGGTINCFNEYWLAENTPARGTNNMSGTAVLNLNNWMSIGRGGVGVFNFTGGTINKTGGGNFIVADGGTGYFTQTPGTTLNINNEFWIGQGGAGVGQYDMSGGTMTIGSWVAIGRGGIGVLNMSGGTITKNGGTGNHFIIGSGVSGTVNQTGGLITNTIGDFWLAENNIGTWNMSGTAQGVVDVLRFAINASGKATLNLNAGATLTASQLAIGNAAGLSTNNMNGGTLKARTSNTAFMQGLTAANILSGGVTIDTDVNTIGIAQPLLDAGGGGGLTKIGSGTLRLNGVNTYSGTTLVSAGTLGGTGTIAGQLSLAAGATLAPGNSIGTLTVNGTLAMAVNSTNLFELSLDGGVTNNDMVIGPSSISYAGSLVVTNAGAAPLVAGTVFKLFNTSGLVAGNFASVKVLPAGSGTFNPATGELTITSSGVLTIAPVVKSGNNLILTGTGGTPGGSYTWVSSTNVAAALNTWSPYATGTFSGTGTFSNAIPVVPTEPARFFRLSVP